MPLWVMVHFQVHVVICVTEDNHAVARRIWKKRAIDFIFKPYDTQRFLIDVNKVVRHILDVREIKQLRKKIKTLEQEIQTLQKKNR